MMLRSALTACVCSLLIACGGGGGGDSTPAFSFSSYDETTFTITVLNDQGDPMRGVSVSVEDVYDATLADDEDAHYEVHLRGLTDAAGRWTGSIRLPSDTNRVDVILHQPGFTGDWTDTEAQSALGFFGPSSRQTVDVSGSITLETTLTAL